MPCRDYLLEAVKRYQTSGLLDKHPLSQPGISTCTQIGSEFPAKDVNTLCSDQIKASSQTLSNSQHSHYAKGKEASPVPIHANQFPSDVDDQLPTERSSTEYHIKISRNACGHLVDPPSLPDKPVASNTFTQLSSEVIVQPIADITESY